LNKIKFHSCRKKVVMTIESQTIPLQYSIFFMSMINWESHIVESIFNIKALIGCNFFFNTRKDIYEGWNFNTGNYLFTTDTK